MAIADVAGSGESQPPVGGGLSLRRNFGWTLVGNLVFYGSHALMLVGLSKFPSREHLGEFVLAVAVSAPIVMLCRLQLEAVLITDVQGEYRFGHYLGLRLATLLLAVLMAGGIGFALYSPARGALISLVALNGAALAVRQVFHAAMQKRERMDCIGIAQIITGLLSVLAFAGAIFLTGNLMVAVAAIIAVQVGMLLLYDRMRLVALQSEQAAGLASIKPIWQTGAMGSLVAIALPLGVVMGMITMQVNVPNYFLDAHSGTKVLGYFGAIAMFLQALNLVGNALGQAAMPRLARYYQQEIGSYQALVFKLVAVGALLGVAGILGAMLLGRWVLALFYTPEYADHNNILILLMIGGGVGCIASFLGYGMTAARHFRIQVPVSGLVLIVALLVSWLLIPSHGMVGAGLALLAAAASRLILQGAVVAYAIVVRSRTQSPPRADGLSNAGKKHGES